jgi:cytochrome c5
MGIAGAPKVGDAGLWVDRIAQGNDTLYDQALNGYQGAAGYMPAKGGFAFLSDDDVKAAVDYMVRESK